eukprot:jgi/Botrbrau1/10906/Bobra.0025s0079.1
MLSMSVLHGGPFYPDGHTYTYMGEFFVYCGELFHLVSSYKDYNMMRLDQTVQNTLNGSSSIAQAALCIWPPCRASWPDL